MAHDRMLQSFVASKDLDRHLAYGGDDRLHPVDGIPEKVRLSQNLLDLTAIVAKYHTLCLVVPIIPRDLLSFPANQQTLHSEGAFDGDDGMPS